MRRVVALVHPPQSTFELGCAAQVFGIERQGLPTRYAFGVCTEHPGPVATHAGYDMLVTDGLDALDRADTVIVPGWPPTEWPPSPPVVRALRHAHSAGRGWSVSASVPSRRRTQGCSTGAGRPLIGHGPTTLPRVSRRSGSTRTCCTSTTVTWPPAPAPEPVSTCACTWSATTTAPGTRHMSHGPWSCRPTVRADSCSTRYRRTPNRSTAHSRRCWNGSPGDWTSRWPSRPWPRTRRLDAHPRPTVRRSAGHQPGAVAARPADRHGTGPAGVLGPPPGRRRPPRRSLLGHQPPPTLPRHAGYHSGRVPPGVPGRSGMTRTRSTGRGGESAAATAAPRTWAVVGSVNGASGLRSGPPPEDPRTGRTTGGTKRPPFTAEGRRRAHGGGRRTGCGCPGGFVP